MSVLEKFCILLTLFRSGSPYKLNYSKRNTSTRNADMLMAKKPSTSRRESRLDTRGMYESDLVVEAERESRRLFERSAVFEYWWDDKNISNTFEKRTGRFNTMPLFFHGERNDFGSKAGKDEKMSNVDGMSKSWAGNLNRIGHDISRDVNCKADFKL